MSACCRSRSARAVPGRRARRPAPAGFGAELHEPGGRPAAQRRGKPIDLTVPAEQLQRLRSVMAEADLVAIHFDRPYVSRRSRATRPR